MVEMSSYFSYTSFLTTTSDAFPYSQPPLTELLILLSFIYLLNLVRVGADYFLHAGIVAMICLGMIYGAPLAGILPQVWEGTFTALGYLGLIGIVFEGGLSTNLPLLLSNLPLSLLCAVHLLQKRPNDGVLLPPTSVVARNKDSSAVSVSSAGAAMNVPLQQTRIGTILISAAVIDDVIGLVLAAMIPELSALNNGDSHSNLIWTIIHPLVFSFLITVVTPLVARYLLRPIFWFRGFGEQWCAPVCPGKRWGARIFFGISSENPRSSGWGTEAHADAAKLFLMVGFVSAFSAIAHYTGSSVLFGAYLAGCVLRYISRPSDIKIEDLSPQGSDNIEVIVKRRLKQLSFEETFIRIVGPIQQYVFAPLFFASIGYAIPFISLWRPKVFWRGMLYSLLMAVGKLAVGLPILASTIWPPDPNITQPGENSGGFWASHVHRTLACFSRERTVHPTPHNRHEDIELPRLTSTRPLPTSPSPVSLTVSNDGVSQQTLSPALPVHLRPPFVTRLKLSLAPAFFIGSAMIARGEIGLLIAQIARNGSKAGSNAGGALLGEEAFLVCIWAILLCTLVGPIGVGFVVRWWGPFVSRGIWH
ncbi:unnamed protein product [Somion occarium]|uniref:Cation/H+ exchanger domain-containing protein n=1 Tax=Somion occarium TaxID=3059160 RepID=A0ABP1ECA7_9APHY